MKRGKTYDWIPLWIDKWIWGSTRHELDPSERSVWVDLMALAGKDDGFIRANETTAYPPKQLAGMFCVASEILEKTIEKCIEHGKLSRDKDGILKIVNWSEYSLSGRHKRRLGKPCPPKRTSCPTTRTHVSVSVSYIGFNSSSQKWEGIKEDDLNKWKEAYPACEIKTELAKMAAWLMADWPARRKIKWKAFIVRWLAKAQDQGGTKKGRASASWDDFLKGEPDDKK